MSATSDILTWVEHRLSEKTTWIGLLSLVPMAAWKSHSDLIATVGSLAVAAVAVVIKDHHAVTILNVVDADAPVIANAVAQDRRSSSPVSQTIS